MSTILLPEDTRSTKYLYGDIELKAAQQDMVMSGYVSTRTADLVNDIVDPQAFAKHLWRYENNPVYCWNHDRGEPIGYVESVEITDKGLYLRNIHLTPTPIVKDKIWPLVKAGALRQQSIGFLPKEGKPEGKFWKHTEIYLLECSLVTVACNPDAELDVIKGFEGVDSLDDLIQAYNKGVIKMPSEIRKDFYVSGFRDEELPKGEPQVLTPNNPLSPDFTDIKVIELSDEQKGLYDSEGEAVESLPKKNIHKNYDNVAQLVFLAKSTLRDSYMFRVGSLTKSGGFKYDWESVALSTGAIMGAKGQSYFVGSEKLALLSKLFEIYGELGKTIPTYEDVPLNDVDEKILLDLKFHEVKFNEGEDEVIRLNIFNNNLKNVSDTLQYFKDKTPEVYEEQIKMLMPQILFRIDSWSPDETELAFINGLIASLQQFMAAEAASEDDAISAYSEEYDSPEGALKQFAEYILANVKQVETVDEEVVESEEEVVEEEEKALESEEMEAKLEELRLLLQNRRKI